MNINEIKETAKKNAELNTKKAKEEEKKAKKEAAKAAKEYYDYWFPQLKKEFDYGIEKAALAGKFTFKKTLWSGESRECDCDNPSDGQWKVFLALEKHYNKEGFKVERRHDGTYYEWWIDLEVSWT